VFRRGKHRGLVSTSTKADKQVTVETSKLVSTITLTSLVFFSILLYHSCKLLLR